MQPLPTDPKTLRAQLQQQVARIRRLWRWLQRRSRTQAETTPPPPPAPHAAARESAPPPQEAPPQAGAASEPPAAQPPAAPAPPGPTVPQEEPLPFWMDDLSLRPEWPQLWPDAWSSPQVQPGGGQDADPPAASAPSPDEASAPSSSASKAPEAGPEAAEAGPPPPQAPAEPPLQEQPPQQEAGPSDPPAPGPAPPAATPPPGAAPAGPAAAEEDQADPPPPEAPAADEKAPAPHPTAPSERLGDDTHDHAVALSHKLLARARQRAARLAEALDEAQDEAEAPSSRTSAHPRKTEVPPPPDEEARAFRREQSLEERIEELRQVLNIDPIRRPVAMTYIIMYDIQSNYLRTTIQKYLERMGLSRIQWSVYMGSLDQRLFRTIRDTIGELCEQGDKGDSVIYVPIAKGEFDRIELQGQDLDLRFVTHQSRVIFV